MDVLKSGNSAAVHIVSANVFAQDSINEAQAMLDSVRHQAAKAFYEKVDHALGLAPNSRDTVGWWQGTVEASTLTGTQDPPSPENVRLAAALKGLFSAQAAAAIFVGDQEGQDLFYELKFVHKTLHEVLSLLEQGKFEGATLESTDGEIRVQLIDERSENISNYGVLAAHAEEKSVVRGRTELIGGGLTRQEAVEHYRKILDEGGAKPANSSEIGQLRIEAENNCAQLWEVLEFDRRLQIGDFTNEDLLRGIREINYPREVLEFDRRLQIGDFTNEDPLRGIREIDYPGFAADEHEHETASEDSVRAVTQYVKGAGQGNAQEFIRNVLIPNNVNSRQELEKLASEARLRDWFRAANPVVIGVGFLPAASVSLAFPPSVAKELSKAFLSNLGVAALTPILNEMAEHAVQRGSLGPKYLEQPEQRIKEEYLLSFSLTFGALAGIAALANANPEQSAIAKLWCGGLVGGVLFGLLNQFDRERSVDDYKFLDRDQPAEAAKKIQSLRQGRLRAVGGYAGDFLFKSIFDDNKNNIMVDFGKSVKNSVTGSHTLAATLALLPHVAMATAAGLSKDPAKAAALGNVDSATLAVQWMSRRLYQSGLQEIGKRLSAVFNRTRATQRDLETGSHRPGSTHSQAASVVALPASFAAPLRSAFVTEINPDGETSIRTQNRPTAAPIHLETALHRPAVSDILASTHSQSASVAALQRSASVPEIKRDGGTSTTTQNVVTQTAQTLRARPPERQAARRMSI